MVKYLQKLGSSLMLPVSVLVVASLFMGLGYAIDSGAMSGSDNTLAVFLVQAGLVVIGNLAILFAVGVAVGLAEDNNGVAGLAGLVAWLMMTSLLAPDTIAVILNLPVEEVHPAFGAIENVFVGIISGSLAGWAYNRFHTTKLPQWLAFFSGRRFVAIATAFFAVLIAVVLYFVWPALYSALTWVGQSIAGLGALGAGLFGFFNRLLIPTGLHHALNNVFWFDTFGINDIGNFWASTGTQGVTGMYQAGFFPIMMFGLPGAALAMFKNADADKKGLARGLLLSGAIATFVTGITEPLEFSFMFVAPQLYLVHAILTGISLFVSSLLNATAGFSFSAGLIDYILSFNMPLANKPIYLLVLGLVFGVLYFVIFDFMIKKFDLKTPGRGIMEGQGVAGPANQPAIEDKHTAMAQEIYAALGGASNIQSITNCATRLRLEVKDTGKVDEARIQRTGVPGVRVLDNKNMQVIVGTEVQFVADQVKKLAQEDGAGLGSASGQAPMPEPVPSQPAKQAGSSLVTVQSPGRGRAIALADVDDPAFSSKALGEGLAIDLEGDQLVSPVAGEIITAFPTGHAVGIKAENGAEILVHIGLNTVELQGQGFKLQVQEGDRVEPGDLLVTLDSQLIRDKGYPLTTPIVVTNSSDYTISQLSQVSDLEPGEPLYVIEA